MLFSFRLLVLIFHFTCFVILFHFSNSKVIRAFILIRRFGFIVKSKTSKLLFEMVEKEDYAWDCATV